ncbi:hypothetical protein RRG08_005523 [Elysia crispata]|uniref:Uncharacterized protein n=1 Tax=Elysia crispata TaxID=231223 RepID=A0AAE0XSF4_9GAST|nr:hypothetical protein RRG08_005523 [Elysia crispata]
MDQSRYALFVSALAGFTALSTLPCSAATCSDSKTKAPPRYTLTVDVTKSLHITSPKFLSLTLAGGHIRHKLEGFDYRSKKLQNLAKALSPAIVRIGGTYTDYIYFIENPSSSQGRSQIKVRKIDKTDSIRLVIQDKNTHRREGNKQEDAGRERTQQVYQRVRYGRINYAMTGEQWDNITRFYKTVGWDMMWDFNILVKKNGSWDPWNAKKFLEYSASRNVKIPMFQLGNEPNLGKPPIKAEQLAKDHRTLKTLLSGIPQYAASAVFGPSVTNLDRNPKPRNYLIRFLEACGCETITELCLHHYYLKRFSPLRDFMDVKIMEGLRIHLQQASHILWSTCGGRKRVSLTETSTATGGGVPRISNAFVAGFLWLDKLGLSAIYGVTHVFRQTFYSAPYALVTDTKLIPNPDYYLSVIYKRLVEGHVFRVNIEFLSPMIRIYAHCARNSFYNYPDGAIVVYYLNIAATPSNLSLGQFEIPACGNQSQVDLFIFTASTGDMKDRVAKLNGKELKMNGPNLPDMDPQRHTGDVSLPAKSYGFIVIPEAGVALCRCYHRFAN